MYIEIIMGGKRYEIAMHKIVCNRIGLTFFLNPLLKNNIYTNKYIPQAKQIYKIPTLIINSISGTSPLDVPLVSWCSCSDMFKFSFSDVPS